MPKFPIDYADKSLYTKPMASPPMGGSRSCQRQTCTFQPHCQRSCRAQVTLRLVPRCRVISHRKQFVYYSRAAVSVPFRRLPTHSPGWRFPTLRIGRPNLDLRSRLGLPVPNPKSLSVLLPTQAFCIPLPRQHLPAHNRCKFPTHRTEPPSHATRKLHAHAQVSPCQVFFLAHPAPRTQSGGSRFFSRSSLHVGTP